MRGHRAHFDELFGLSQILDSLRVDEATITALVAKEAAEVIYRRLHDQWQAGQRVVGVTHETLEQPRRTVGAG